MESNNRNENKPDRSKITQGTSRRAEQAEKAIEAVKSRSQSRMKQREQKRQLIIVGAALLAVIVLVVAIVLIAKGCSGGNEPAVDTTVETNVTEPVGDDTPVDSVIEPDNTAYSAEEYLSRLPFTLYYDPEIDKMVSEVALNGGEWDAEGSQGYVSVGKLDVYAAANDADFTYWMNRMAGRSVRVYDASAEGYINGVIDRVNMQNDVLTLTLRSLDTPDNWTYDAGDKLCAPEVTELAQVEALPIISNGTVEENIIVITIDDLTYVDNLHQIMTIAESNGAKLTLFAEGSEVAASDKLQEALRRADQRLEFEIENYTYNHDKGLYSLSDNDMAYQIYMTQVAVSNALGADYEMHFLRTPGGNGEYDLRTHQYLNQLGSYKAIIHWNVYGSTTSKDNLRKGLKAGNIYRFHTSDSDMAKLADFIPYAVNQGYRIVTLNEMFGYESNQKSELTRDYTVTSPMPYAYNTPVNLGNKNYTQIYAVQILQMRLVDLGYLSKTAKIDGDYGSTTTIAVRLFQYYTRLNGDDSMSVDGYAGKGTQALLFSSDALRNPSTIVAGESDTYPRDGDLAEFLSALK